MRVRSYSVSFGLIIDKYAEVQLVSWGLKECTCDPLLPGKPHKDRAGAACF